MKISGIGLWYLKQITWNVKQELRVLPCVFCTRHWIDEGTFFWLILQPAAESVSAGDGWKRRPFNFLLNMLCRPEQMHATHAGDNTTDQVIEAMKENEPAHFIVYSFCAANSAPLHIDSLQSCVNASFCAHYMRIQWYKKTLYCRLVPKRISVLRSRENEADDWLHCYKCFNTTQHRERRLHVLDCNLIRKVRTDSLNVLSRLLFQSFGIKNDLWPQDLRQDSQ